MIILRDCIFEMFAADCLLMSLLKASDTWSSLQPVAWVQLEKERGAFLLFIKY